MRIRRLLIIVVLVALLVPLPTQAASRGASTDIRIRGPRCHLPDSNAEALVILSNYYPGYWWDHTDLTVAVQAHPSATAAQLEAIHGAIATWAEVLDDCFRGHITLTDVSGTIKSEQKAADIVVHYVPTAGGVVF